MQPSDEDLRDRIHFCYTFDLHAGGSQHLALLDRMSVNDWLFRAGTHFPQVCDLKQRG